MSIPPEPTQAYLPEVKPREGGEQADDRGDDVVQEPSVPDGTLGEERLGQDEIVLAQREPNDMVASPPVAAPAPEVRPPPAVFMDEDGFRVEVGGTPPAFAMELGALIQTDARVFFGNPADEEHNDIVLRRVRPRMSGTIYGLVDFKLRVDFGEGDVELTDAAVDIHPWSWLRLVVGKHSPPLGLERLQSNATMPMTEAALDANLSVSRDVGAQLWGDVGRGVLRYQVALMDGAADGTKIDEDEGKHKDCVARLLIMPFAPWARLGALGLGMAGSTGKRDGSTAHPTLGSYKTPGHNRFFAYASSTKDPTDNVYANGQHRRLNPEIFYFIGGFGVLAEAVQSRQVVHRGSSFATLTQRGAHVTGAFVIGGRSTVEGAKPNHPWNPGRGHLGALELDARYGALLVDPKTFPTFADPWASARSARSLGATLQWVPSSLFRFLVSFERVTFDGGAGTKEQVVDRPPELALISRVQLSM